MSSKKHRVTQIKRIHRHQVRNYFEPRKLPVWAPVSFITAIMVLLIGWILGSILLIIVGIVLLLPGPVQLHKIMHANPTDEEYELWVNNQAQALYTRGLQVLGIKQEKLTDDALRVVSFVLPGSFAAQDYPPEETRIKYGRDGRMRFSIYVYTHLYFTEHYLAIFRCDVNAFNLNHVEQHETYHYHHILSAMTKKANDIVIWNNVECPYRTEQLYLKIVSGECIEISATVKATPLDTNRPVPFTHLPHTNFDKTLNRLRHMLHMRVSHRRKPM